MSRTVNEETGEVTESDEEAAEVEEAEEASPGPGGDEAPAESENTPAEDEARLRMRDKSLEREQKRHEKALAALHGDQWEHYAMCPLCVGDGFLMPLPAGAMPDEQWEAATALAGKTPDFEFPTSTKSQRCQECDGRGRTMSGAQFPLDPTKLCDVCSGNGYVPLGPQIAPVVEIPTFQFDQPQPNGVPQNFGSPAPNDAWDRPAGHPHYGIAPNMVTG